jgi:DNA-binding CsgD family transcriptional regulator
MVSWACGGRGGVVAIAGPAGIGKSRLLDAAIAGLPGEGMDRLIARCDERERGFPFAVALQLFEKRLRVAGRCEREALLGDAAGLAAALFDRDASGGALARAPAQLFPFIHGLYWLSANLAERTPLLLAVDDLHACDEPSLRFVLYLAQRLESLPIALLVACRRGEPSLRAEIRELLAAPRVRVLRPAPLSDTAVGALLEEELGFAVDGEFIAACMEVTGGNPFLVRELLAGLATEGLDRATATAARVRSLTPEAVTQRLLVRLTRLPLAAGALARALAVLGDEVPVRTVAALARVEIGQAVEALDALVGAEIVRPPDEHEWLRFVHPLVRGALYGDLPVGERAAAHTRAATLLISERANPERIVPHLMRAQRGAIPESASLLSGAAAEARARGAPGSAVGFLGRALEEPMGVSVRACLQLRLAEAQLAAGDLGGAQQSAQSACSLSTEPEQAARAQLVAGRALYAAARHHEAAAAFRTGLDRLGESGECELGHELRAAYATAAALDASLASQGLAVAGVIVNEQRPDPTLSERAVFAQLAVKRAFAAAPREEVRALAEHAWGDGALVEAEGVDGPIWTLVTMALVCADYVERDAEICTMILDSARASGSVLAFANASFCRTLPVFRLGRVDDAIADTEAAIGARCHGWGQHLGAAAAMLAHALIEKGRLDAAAAALAPIHDPEMRTRVDYALLLEARARLALARGDPEAALRDTAEAGHLFEDVFAMRAPLFDRRFTEALAVAAIGDTARARALGNDMLELTRSIGAPGMIGRALRLLGLIERGDRGRELLAEAIAVLEPVAPRLEHVRALVDYGAALRRADQRRAAREPLERGFRLAIQGGATAVAERARVELAALGARPRKDTIARDELTASERRVAGMAAGGMTNKQIAQSLFVTLKTVEGHLHHAYQKLDIGSRDQLGRALAEREPGGAPASTESALA